MPGAAKITRTETLLAERERQGVRMLTAVRGLFILVMVVSHWVVGFSVFEKIAATVIGLPAFGLICVFFAMLVDRRPVAAVGLAGSLMDVAILGMLPVIWYVSVGGADVPPAYMLKTQITVLTLGLVALNALAIRPLYPIVVAGGGVAVHVALLVYILRDPRTIISPDFTKSAMGSALSLELFVTDLLVIVLAGAALAFLTFLARRTIFQGVKLEVANASLARHFSPGVVSRIVGESEPLSGVGGRTQDVAVMFCDIRDFTTMTENLPPPDVVAFLSQYHARMVEVIFGFGGTIDKFIGDAIMVTFGTPDTAEDDAERAVRAGLAMNAALAGLNAERTERGLPEIRHGIGIHFGPVIAGNIGTEDRLEYTVIGDTVNVASRIQDACKTAGENLLISEAVRERLPPDIGARPLPEQHVRGRKAPVQIYAIVDGLSSG